MYAFEKTAAPFSGARKAISRHRNTLAKRKELRGKRSEEVNGAVKDIDSKYQAGIDSANRRISHFRRKAGGVAAKGAVGVGTVSAVGAGAKKVSNGRKNRADNQSEQQTQEQSYEQPHTNETEQLASSIMHAFEKTASFNGFFNTATLGHHEKTASVASKITSGIMKNVDRVKNLKSNTALMKDLTAQKDAIKAGQNVAKGVDVNETFSNLKDAQRVVGALDSAKRDVAVGRAIAYGVPASVGTAGVIATAKSLSNNKAQVMPEETDEFSKQASFNAPLTHLQTIKRLGQQVVSKGNLLAKRNGDEGLALAASQFQFDNPYMSDLQTGNTLKGNVEGFRNGSFVEKKMIEYGAGALPNVMERLAFDMVQPPSPPAGMPTSAPTITHKPLTPSQPHNLKPVNDKTPMSPPGATMKTITPQNNIQGY